MPVARRKLSRLDRQLKALAKLGKTKSGRDFIAENADGILQALCDGVGK